MENYQRIKVLGKGSFGCATLVKSLKDGKEYVVKEIDMSRMPPAERSAAQQEATLLQKLHHPNIVSCHESFIDNRKLCIVMDYCASGDVYQFLQKQRGQLLPEQKILDMFVQLCLAMKHVHDRKILHRDLKTQNVFISHGGLLKLGDFGVAKVLNATMALAATAVGTPYYLSPEICENRRYNAKSDIWSLGVMLYEITTLKHPFDAQNMKLLIHKIVRGYYPPLPNTYSKGLRDLVGSMIQKDPNMRPTVNDILRLPIIKARIGNFLGQTLHADEFSHTVLHGKPRRGALSPPREAPSPNPFSNKDNSGPPAGVLAAPARPAAAAFAAGADMAEQARQKAAAAALDRESRAKADRDAKTKLVRDRETARMAEEERKRQEREREADLLRQRERERDREKDREREALARLRDEAQMRQEQAERERRRVAEAEQRERELRQREVERRRALEEQRLMEKKQEYVRRLAAEEQRQKEAEVRRHQDDQRKEFAERRAQAARNRAQLYGNEPDVQIYAPTPDAPNHPARRVQQMQELAEKRYRLEQLEKEKAALQRQKDRAMEAVRCNGPYAEDSSSDRGSPLHRPNSNNSPSPVRNAMGGGNLGAISDEERRRAYMEMREAARRNKAQVMGEYLPPPFPAPAPDVPPRSSPSTPAKDPDVWDPPTPRERAPRAGRKKWLEEDAAAQGAREAREQQELLEFQRRNYWEMREAAQRNKVALMADMQGVPVEEPAQPSAEPDPDAPKEEYNLTDEDMNEYAAMVKDMQDAYLDDGEDDSNREFYDEETEDSEGRDGLLPGFPDKITLDGKTLELGPGNHSTPALMAENLRVYLSKELGDTVFLKAYKRMEFLSPEEDEEAVVSDIYALMGEEKIQYLPLIHQLIVCEESLNQHFNAS